MGQPIIAEATVEEAKDELGLPAPPIPFPRPSWSNPGL